MRPSSFAPLSQIVAIQEELRWKLFYLFTVFQFQPWLHHLSEGDGIARSAWFLISYTTSIIITSNISPIKAFWDFIIWNFTCTRVFLLPRLRESKWCFELWPFAECFFASTISLSKFNFIIAMRSVELVMLLVFADISSPSEVWLIDGWNEQVHLIWRHMIMMRIRSLIMSSWSWFVKSAYIRIQL